ncbi:MAG: hypothetical protein ACREOU_01785 [Candidatus Eiseniibacteriota bacterium]
MKIMKTTLCFLFAALVVVAVAPSAFAETKVPNDIPVGPETGPNCDVEGYKVERQVFPTPVPIPDAVPAGVVVGPIFLPEDGDIIVDTIIDLRMSHTWIGDIIAAVGYDPDCDGPAGFIVADLLCRPRGTSASSPPPCGTVAGFGCSADLLAANTLLYSDEALAKPADGVCVNPIAPGCYKPSTALEVFRGLRKGGCWYLAVADNAGADTGAIYEWSVHVRNQRPVPAVPATMGKIKSIYR